MILLILVGYALLSMTFWLGFHWLNCRIKSRARNSSKSDLPDQFDL